MYNKKSNMDLTGKTLQDIQKLIEVFKDEKNESKITQKN